MHTKSEGIVIINNIQTLSATYGLSQYDISVQDYEKKVLPELSRAVVSRPLVSPIYYNFLRCGSICAASVRIGAGFAKS